VDVNWCIFYYFVYSINVYFEWLRLIVIRDLLHLTDNWLLDRKQTDKGSFLIPVLLSVFVSSSVHKVRKCEIDNVQSTKLKFDN